MPNEITKALQRMAAAVKPTVKGVMFQKAPIVLATYYNDYLQPNTKPDRVAKSGRRYYSRPNTTNKLRTLYGNIQRALSPDARNKGNITDVTVAGDTVVLVSGIDENVKVQAGPDMITLVYARLHEQGTSRYKARPFLGPGMEAFVKEAMPDLVDEIADRLLEAYNG